MKKIKALYERLKNDPLSRSQIYETLRDNVSEYPNFISASLELINTNEINLESKLLIMIGVRQMIEEYWHSLLISSTEKDNIKNKIFNQMEKLINDKKSLFIYADIVIEIVEKENGWDSLIEKITGLLNIENENILHILALLHILLESVGEQFTKNDQLYKTLYMLFTEGDTTPVFRGHIIACAQLLIKSVIHQKKLSVDHKLLHVEEFMKIWSGVFPMILASKDPSLIPLKVHTIAIYTTLVRDFKWALNEKSFMALPHIIKCLFSTINDYYQFCYSSIENQKMFTQFAIGSSDEFLNFSNPLDALVIGICELIENLCFYEPMTDVIRNLLFPVLWSLCLLYIPKPWIYDEELNISVNSIVLSTISTIIERFDHDAIKIIIDLSNILINSNDSQNYIKEQFDIVKASLLAAGVDIKLIKVKPYEIETKYLSNSRWKLKELGLTLLDKFKEDIVGYMAEEKILDGDLLINQILIILKTQTHVKLILRALDALSIFRYANKINLELFLELYAKISEMMSSKYQLKVRLSASRVLTILSYKIATDKLQSFIREKLGNTLINKLIKDAMDLAIFIEETHVLFYIDNMLSLYDIAEESYADIFISHGMQSFLRVYRQCMIKNTQTPLFIDFINRIFNNKQIQPIIFASLVDIYSLYLNEFDETVSGYEGLDHILNVVLSASNHKLSFNGAVSLIDQLVDLAYNSNHSVAKLKITLIVKNITLYELVDNDSVSSIIKQAKNLYLKQLSINENEANCCYIGNLALSLYTKTTIDNQQEFLTALIRKLNKSALPLTNQGIAVFISYLMLIDPVNTLNRISEVQVNAKYGFKVLFDHWLLHQPKFTGPRAKSITVQTLLRFLTTYDYGLNNLYVIGLKLSHKANSSEIKLPVKIIALLKEIIAFEKKMLTLKVKKNLNTDQRRQFYLEEGDRLETEFESENDDDYSGNEMLSDSQNLNVDINIEYDNEDDSFNNNGANINGLAGIETGSQSYMSGLLGFDEVDGAEYDENTENDLKYLGVEEIDVVDTIKKFMIAFKKTAQFKNIEKDIDHETMKFLNSICL